MSLKRNLDLMGVRYEGPNLSAFTWGDGFWAQELESGKVNLTLFGITADDAAKLIKRYRKERGQ